MWYELFIFLKWVEKNSYLNGLMEVFFVKFLRFSNLCGGFNHLLLFSEWWRSSLSNFFDIFLKIRFEHVWSNPNTTLFWRIYMCCKRKLQHTCFHFWNFIKTFVEMPKITVDVSVNKSKCVKVGNADAVEGATLKQTANFFTYVTK